MRHRHRTRLEPDPDDDSDDWSESDDEAEADDGDHDTDGGDDYGDVVGEHDPAEAVASPDSRFDFPPEPCPRVLPSPSGAVKTPPPKRSTFGGDGAASGSPGGSKDMAATGLTAAQIDAMMEAAILKQKAIVEHTGTIVMFLSSTFNGMRTEREIFTTRSD